MRTGSDLDAHFEESPASPSAGGAFVLFLPAFFKMVIVFFIQAKRGGHPLCKMSGLAFS
jgi:hypothetical protein